MLKFKAMLQTRTTCRCLTLVLQVLVLLSQCWFTRSHLDLYVAREDLKKDLKLDFGSDIYIVAGGKPAPLLANPDAFRDLVAPLIPSINRLKFRWRTFPNGNDKSIRYSLDLSSSDLEVMEKPTTNIVKAALVPWYDHIGAGLEMYFPCSGKRTGLVDLGFHLNYTTIGSNDAKQVNIIVRRHCLKTVTEKNATISIDITPMGSIDSTTWTRNLIIGLSTSLTLIIIICASCFIYCYMQKRNRKLQMKFDYDYELKMKQREEEEHLERTPPQKDFSLELYEHEELLHQEQDTPSKPIFIPKRSKDHHHKWKKNRRRRHLNLLVENGTPPPAYSMNPNYPTSPSSFGRGLEKIPEEDMESTEESYSETDEDSPIIENSYSVNKQSNNNDRTSLINSCGGSTSSLNSINTTSSGYNTADSTLKSNISNSEQTLSSDTSFKKRTHKHTSVHRHISCSNQQQQHHHRHGRDHIVNISQDNEGYQPSPCKKAPLPNHRHRVHRVTASDIVENHSVVTSLLSDDEKLPIASESIEDLYKYLNGKWTSQFQDCLLSSQQVIIDNHPLGKGAFGRVHRGKAKGLNKDNPTKMTSVAVKIMIPTSDFDTITTFVSEALLMKNFEHENVMKLLGVVLQTTQPPLIVTPFMKHADLNQFLRSARATPRRHQALSTRQLINFGLQIASGMEYLAKMGYVHRDLASRNCMVSEALTIKIADFGLARDISKEHYRMNRKTRLPIKWMALESLTDYIFSEKTDAWSYGVVLWELMTLGKQPYSGLDNQDMEEYLVEGKRLQQPQNCPDEIYDIMILCWLDLPEKRPIFTELRQRLVAYEAKYKKYSLGYGLPITTQVV